MKTTHLICKTSFYNGGSGTWQPLQRFTLHERISYRGTNPQNHLAGFSKRPDLTKEEKREDYEYRMCEKNIRPFTYSDEQWQDHINWIKEEDFIAKCEEKTAWMYEF